MSRRLEGKVAIITGSTTGIGRATAELFASEGAKVVVTGRREYLGNEVVEGIQANGGEAIFVRLDASSEESIKNMVSKCVEAFRTVDILVNNVGSNRNGFVHQLTSEDFDHVIALDLKSYFLATKYVLPIMLEKKSGNIVNVSSAAVNSVLPTSSLYQISKNGINALSRVVAREYADQGIRCNVVAPGFTETDIFGCNDEAGKARIDQMVAQQVPMKRMAKPIEIAYPILFCASDESSYCSGRIIDANGAWAL